MQQFECIIESKAGLHAKAALLLSMTAKSYPCRIWVQHNGRTADAKNVMKLLMLAARHQDKLIFFLEGDGEEEAARELKEYCIKNL